MTYNTWIERIIWLRSGPKTVLVGSLIFIAVVIFLHIVGKYNRSW